MLPVRRRGGLAQKVRALFAAGEQGAWYDPSDFSTLFQDSAGTTPVTAVEQPVGLMLDKSGRGNHAFQSTPTSRPTLSARVNLLTKTEQFNDAVWVKNGITISANTADTTDPLGGNTADKATSAGTATEFQGQVVTVPSGILTTFSVALKKGNFDWARVALWDEGSGTPSGTSQSRAWFNLATGTVGTINSASAGTVPTASITSLGNGWYRCTITGSIAGTTSYAAVVTTAASDGSVTKVTGGEYYIWGADLRVANDGVGLPVYQRVDTATSYDTAGFPLYLRFDGSDDSFLTNSVDFSGTDKVTAWAGVRKLSDATSGIFLELDTLSSNGTFAFTFSSSSGANSYRYSSFGTTAIVSAGTGVFAAAPDTSVITGISDIAGDIVTLRRNAAVVETTTTDQGSGNYRNAPLYIGRRTNSTLPYNGRLYSLIIRGAQSTATQIAQTESYVNSKTRAF